MQYPKQLNAFAVAKVLGPDPITVEVAIVKKRLRRHLLERGPFSYDFFRRNSFALISHQKRLATLIEECSKTGQPLGRTSNIDVMQHALAQYAGRAYQTFPVRPAIKEVKDGLIIRAHCTLYIVEQNQFSFEVYQPSRSIDYSAEQIEFTSSLFVEALVRDDYAKGRVCYWDFCWNEGKTARRADSYLFDSANRISKKEIDRVLTIYGAAYDELIAEGLPPEVWRPGHSFEDRQYDFWRG